MSLIYTLYFLVCIFFLGFMLSCILLHTYSICILLAIRQVLYPLVCIRPCMDLQNAK